MEAPHKLAELLPVVNLFLLPSAEVQVELQPLMGPAVQHMGTRFAETGPMVTVVQFTASGKWELHHYDNN